MNENEMIEALEDRGYRVQKKPPSRASAADQTEEELGRSLDFWLGAASDFAHEALCALRCVSDIRMEMFHRQFKRGRKR